MVDKSSQNRPMQWVLIVVSLVLGVALIFLALQYRHVQSAPPATASVPAPQSETAPIEPSPAPVDPAQTPDQTPTQTQTLDPTAGQTLPAAAQSSVTPTQQNISANASVPAPKPDESETFKEFKPKTVYDIAQLPVPPQDDEKSFVDFMRKTRSEDPLYLSLRFRRCLSLIKNKDLWRDKEIKAFLLTPRENFCIKLTLAHAYDKTFLDIGYGQTISGPYIVGRMTSVIDVQPGEKVLEIGTGSGYQSAILSHLTPFVYTIEIVDPLAVRAHKKYIEMAQTHYPEVGNIARKYEDGYYGWPEHAPFDKIIVTCGIDHIPPELLKELKTGGIMVIPVGPPGAQVVLKITKNVDNEGNLVIMREDIYQGRKKAPFVAFTKKGGGTWNK